MLLFAALSTAGAATFDQLVADPVATLLADRNTPGGFRMVALSHAAEVCVARADRACVSRVVEGALDPRLSPYGRPVSEVADLGNHGLFLTHLAIVLGAADQLAPEGCPRDLHERIAAHLESLAVASAAGVGPSYPSASERWPADQAATVYALWLDQRAHGTDHLTGPLQRYLAVLPPDRLPPNELTGAARDADSPRGSALTFSVRYLGPVAPEVAKDLWTRTRAAGFVQKVGALTAVREWPPGVVREADIDSGPIVSGFGASATAFGQAAAAAVGDRSAADALGRTAAVGRGLMGTWLPAEAGESALAAAIAAQAELRP